MCTLNAKCSICGGEGNYELSEEEYSTLQLYQVYGRNLGIMNNVKQINLFILLLPAGKLVGSSLQSLSLYLRVQAF